MKTDDLIDRFLDACQRAANSRGERAQAIGRLVTKLATDLREKRDALLAKLNNGWDFLIQHEGRDDYAALEDRWIAWLAQYTHIEDALVAGREVWLGGEACPS